MNYPNVEIENRKKGIREMSMVAIMTAVTCVLAPISIPIGPVPISLTNLAIYLSLYLLGWKKGSLSVVIYLLIGLAGVPVFSGFSGGLGKLLGPTGGYIVGFLPMAMITGLIMERQPKRAVHFLGMLLGTAVCYALGTAWFCTVMDTSPEKALGLCVYPFIPLDLLKMAATMLLGPILRERLQRAGLSV